MNSIEILALIFSLLVLLKIFFVIFNPKKWVKKTVCLLDKRILLTWIPLTILVGYFVFQSIAIEKIAAVTLLVSLVMGITFLTSSKMIVNIRNTFSKQGIGKFWFSILIWTVFAIITLYNIIF